jgi:hypothetical protein
VVVDKVPSSRRTIVDQVTSSRRTTTEIPSLRGLTIKIQSSRRE